MPAAATRSASWPSPLAVAIWPGTASQARLIWLALIVAFFTAVQARQRAAAVASLVIGYAASVWPPWLIGSPGHATAGFAVGLAVWLLFLLAVAEVIRARGQRTAALERSRQEELRRRAGEERMRIARDLHDVVAHNISVINVQANTALHLMDRQPERARSALATINEVSGQALAELRSVLGVLRAVDEGAPRAPAPGPGAAGRAGRYRGRRRAGRPGGGKRSAGPAASGRRPGCLPDRPGGADQQRPPLRRHQRHRPHRLPGGHPGARRPRRRRPAAWPASRSGPWHGQRHRWHDRTGGRARRHASGLPRPGGGFAVHARLPLHGLRHGGGDR